MRCLIFCVAVLTFYSSMSVAKAQDKVVVIPFTKTVQAPIKPYAPVTAPSPSNTDYSVGSFMVGDNVTGLVWQKEDDNIPKTRLRSGYAKRWVQRKEQ